MTVSSDITYAGPYSGNGAIDTYNFSFDIRSTSELVVYETDSSQVVTTLTHGSGVTVVISSPGGTVQRTAGNLPSGSTWIIRPAPVIDQLTPFKSQTSFSPTLHEDAFDFMTRVVQNTQDQVDRSLKLAPSDANALTKLLELPPISSLMGKALMFNATTGDPEAGPTSTEIANAQANATAAAASAALAQSAVATSVWFLGTDNYKIGLNQAPSTLWGSTYVVLEVSDGGAFIYSTTTHFFGLSKSLGAGVGCYHDGTSWKYEDTSTAARIEFDSFGPVKVYRSIDTTRSAGATVTWSSTDLSDPVAETGYTRVGRGVYTNDTHGVTALTHNVNTTVPTPGGATNIRALILNITIQPVGANAIGARYGLVSAYSDAGFAVLSDRVEARTYEFTAIPGTVVIGGQSSEIIVPVVGGGANIKFSARDSGGNTIAYYNIAGYLTYDV